MLKSHSTFATPRKTVTLKSELRNMANNKNLLSKTSNLTNTSKSIATMQSINQKWVIWEKCDRCSSSVHLIHNMLHDPTMLHLSRQLTIFKNWWATKLNVLKDTNCMCFSTLVNSAEQYSCNVYDCSCILHIYNITRPGMYSCLHLVWLGLTSQAEIMDYQIGPSNATERVYKIPKPKVTTLSQRRLPSDVQVANRAELNSSSHLFLLFSFFFPAIRNLMEQLRCLPRHHAQMHHCLWQMLLL